MTCEKRPRIALGSTQNIVSSGQCVITESQVSFELYETIRWDDFTVDPRHDPLDNNTVPNTLVLLPDTNSSKGRTLTLRETLEYRKRELDDRVNHNEMGVWLYWFTDSEWHWHPREDVLTLNRLAPNILFEQTSASLNETPFSFHAENRSPVVRASKFPSPQLAITQLLSVPLPCEEQDTAPWNSFALFSMLMSRFVQIERCVGVLSIQDPQLKRFQSPSGQINYRHRSRARCRYCSEVAALFIQPSTRTLSHAGCRMGHDIGLP